MYYVFWFIYIYIPTHSSILVIVMSHNSGEYIDYIYMFVFIVKHHFNIHYTI